MKKYTLFVLALFCLLLNVTAGFAASVLEEMDAVAPPKEEKVAQPSNSAWAELKSLGTVEQISDVFPSNAINKKIAGKRYNREMTVRFTPNASGKLPVGYYVAALNGSKLTQFDQKALDGNKIVVTEHPTLQAGTTYIVSKAAISDYVGYGLSKMALELIFPGDTVINDNSTGQTGAVICSMWPYRVPDVMTMVNGKRVKTEVHHLRAGNRPKGHVAYDEFTIWSTVNERI